MLRSKLGLLGLCAMALGLMAFMTSSASASEWVILNSKGEAKIAAALPAQVVGEFEKGTDGTLHSKLVGIKLSVLCTAFTLEGTKLESTGTLTTGGRVTFKGCTVSVPAGNICEVNSPGQPVGTILSNKGKGQLEKNGETLIEPETGTIFAELVFSGAECTLPTGVSEPINGKLWIKDCEGKVETHLVKHLIQESTAHGKTLWIGKDTVEHLETELLGSAWAFLTGGSPTHSGLAWGATLS